MASFRCYDNSDVIANLIMTNFSTFLFMVTQFMLKLGIDPEKLYRATFICSYMTVRPHLCCCNMALVSFRLFRENLGNCCEIFLGVWFTPQPPFLAKKVPYMAYYWQFLISVKGILSNHKNKKTCVWSINIQYLFTTVHCKPHCKVHEDNLYFYKPFFVV